MEFQYYIQYILSWIYHNVLYTDATFAMIRILLFIGLVSLFVYREYVLFTVLCIIVISAECFRFMKEANGAELENMLSGLTAAVSDARVFDKDELTKGVPITREGFSFSFPKIVQGDDSGTDHRRSNKFIEEDSNDFTDKYFNSKQCSIGSGIGGISMFGSNELLEGTTRNTVISGIYDFAGKYSSAIRSDTDRATYFKDCVYDPVYRSQNGAGDFRVIKKQMYDDINNQIINIKRCTARFNTEILFNTSSDITADISKPIYLSNMKSDMAEFTSNILYKSLIAGNTNSDKMKNIQPLNKGSKGDNASDQTYSNLLQSINSNGRYIYNDALKQKHLNIYSKVYGYRKRIDEILSMMRDQTKNDAAKLYTVRVDETIVQELRMILSYLMIIERTNDIIKFEMNYSNTNNGMDIYGKLGNPTLEEFADEDINNELVDKINGANSIFKIPLEDDTYNTNDEKRYLYGITYYFNSGP
jgi:hypothetical protein